MLSVEDYSQGSQLTHERTAMYTLKIVHQQSEQRGHIGLGTRQMFTRLVAGEYV